MNEVAAKNEIVVYQPNKTMRLLSPPSTPDQDAHDPAQTAHKAAGTRRADRTADRPSPRRRSDREPSTTFY